MICLNPQSKEIQVLCKTDLRLAKVVQEVGPISYSVYSDPFTFLVNTIIGQMLSNKVADILTDRFWNLCSKTPQDVSKLSLDKIKSIGISYSKARYINILANEYIKNPYLSDKLQEMSDDNVIDLLTKIPGIGSWTAKMYLIFVLDRKDVLPYEDGAFNQAFEAVYGISDKSKGKCLVRDFCKIWHPYSSIAARYLYKYLDMGFVDKNKKMLM